MFGTGYTKDEYMKCNLNSMTFWRDLRYTLMDNYIYTGENLRFPTITLNEEEIEFVKLYGLKSLVIWREFDSTEKKELEVILKSYKKFWELYDKYYEDLILYSIMYRNIHISPLMQDGYSISFFNEKKDEIIGFKEKLIKESSSKSTIALLYLDNISVFPHVFNKYENFKFQTNGVIGNSEDIWFMFEKRRPKIFSIEHLSDNQCQFIISHKDELAKEYDNIFKKLFGESINKQNNSLKEMFISYCNKNIDPYSSNFLKDYRGNIQCLIEYFSTYYSIYQERQNSKMTYDTFWREVAIVQDWCEIVMEPIVRDRLERAEKNRQKEHEREREEYEKKLEIDRLKEEARKEIFRFNQRNKHPLDSTISFRASDHFYIINEVCLESVTSFVNSCFPKFNTELHAKLKAGALGISIQEVIDMWEKKGKESRELSIAMHEKIENYYQGNDSANDDTFKLFRIFASNIKLVPYRTKWAVYDWKYKLAGTIDFVDYQNGIYTIYDWKRSDKIITCGMPIKTNKYGEKGNYPLGHIDNSPYYHYALQLSLYKFILERNYGIKIDKLRLGIFHPTYNKPYLLEVPYLENEINTIISLRSEVIF